MEKVAINVSQYRCKLEKFGTFLGKEIYSVKEMNADPKYNEKKRIGDDILPNTPIKMYAVDRHNIIGANVDRDASGAVVVILTDTNGEQIRASINSPEFEKPCVSSVRDAIAKKAECGETIFFADCGALTKEVNLLNDSQRTRANQLAREMAAQAEALTNLMEVQTNAQKEYYNSLNECCEETVIIK